MHGLPEVGDVVEVRISLDGFEGTYQFYVAKVAEKGFWEDRSPTLMCYVTDRLSLFEIDSALVGAVTLSEARMEFLADPEGDRDDVVLLEHFYVPASPEMRERMRVLARVKPEIRELIRRRSRELTSSMIEGGRLFVEWMKQEERFGLKLVARDIQATCYEERKQLRRKKK